MALRLPRVVALFVLLSAGTLGAQVREPAPGPHCLDARAIERVRAIDDNTLVVAAQEGRFVVAHASGCDPEQPSSLVAVKGWVCGGAQEFLRSGDRTCPVLSVTRVDARTYAGLAAVADQRRAKRDAAGRPTLETTEVTAPLAPARGFRGNADYCFAVSAVRAWSMRGNDILVQTSPRRAAGHRSYQVELATSCPELDRVDTLDFVSGVGIGMICGHPGDRAVPSGVNRAGPTARMRMGSACPITAVYPLD